MARIALDAMGGDHAPGETVAGAVQAAAEGVDVVLVGDQTRLEEELAKRESKLPIVDAPDVVGMADDPARALREKPDSSISVAAKLVASGEADGFVSAGSTGAAMAAAAIIIGRVKGVARPAIATIFPTPGTPTLVLDSGANPDVKPEQLVQFALMGSAASEVLLGTRDPRVGLLSIGEEKGKGRDLERAAYELLERAPIRFVGNVEGRDVAADKSDVIVTDGFTGNIFLKTMEGAAQVMVRYAMEAISTLDAEIQESVMPALAEVRRRLDYETYGGAQLLGVKGVVVIAHGTSSRVAVANALVMAAEGAKHDLPGR
ncbi:MAG TPA: phosphate acyltransferase PlsX, partial [Acidimicrobiia bacterium]|nr:phosphate acyltransferase PlsX [Acidimicrobiia bacterium]